MIGQLDGLIREAVLNDLMWSSITGVGLAHDASAHSFCQSSNMVGLFPGYNEGRSLLFKVAPDPAKDGTVHARCSFVEHPEIFYSFFRPQGAKAIRFASTTSPDVRWFENAPSVAVPITPSWFNDYMALAAKDPRRELLRKMTLAYALNLGHRGHFFIAPTTPHSTETRIYWLEESRFLRVIIPSTDEDVQNSTQLIRETERPAFAEWVALDEKQRLWNEALALQHYRDAWICLTFGACVVN